MGRHCWSGNLDKNGHKHVGRGLRKSCRPAPPGSARMDQMMDEFVAAGDDWFLGPLGDDDDDDKASLASAQTQSDAEDD